MPESYPNGQKTPWENKKLLITSNFSFSHNVFKGLVAYCRRPKNRSLFGRQLRFTRMHEKQIRLNYYFYAAKKYKRGMMGSINLKIMVEIFFYPMYNVHHYWVKCCCCYVVVKMPIGQKQICILNFVTRPVILSDV